MGHRLPDTPAHRIVQSVTGCAAGRRHVDDATLDVLSIVDSAASSPEDLCDYIVTVMNRVSSGQMPVADAVRDLLDLSQRYGSQD